MGRGLADFGMQAATSAVGGIFDLAFSGLKNDQQINQQSRLNVLQREMMDYSQKKQMEMWEATNYKAQMEQLTKAGLNPALIYGMSGGGGATTGSGGAGGHNAQGAAGAASGAQMAQVMGQLGLMRAQKENIEADTANKKAVTEKTSGVDTDAARQGILSSISQQKLTETQNRLLEIKEKYADATEANLSAIVAEDLNIRKEQLQIIENDANISEATQDDRIKQIKREALGALYKNLNTIADTKLKGEQQKQVKELAYQLKHQTDIMIENKSLGWEQLREHMLQRYANEPDDNPFKDILGVVIGFLGGKLGGKAPTPIRGFHDRSY